MMTVLSAFCFSLVADGQIKFLQQSFSYVLDAWMPWSFFLVEYNTIGVGVDIKIPENCLAGLLHIKRKKEHACFYKRIIFLQVRIHNELIFLMSFNLSLSVLTLIFSKSAFHCLHKTGILFIYFQRLIFQRASFVLEHLFVLFFTHVVTFQESQSTYDFNYLQFLIRKLRVSKQYFLGELSLCCSFMSYSTFGILRTVSYTPRYFKDMWYYIAINN